MLKLLILAASATLLPLSIFAGSIAAHLLPGLPPLHVESRSDGARALAFVGYKGLA